MPTRAHVVHRHEPAVRLACTPLAQQWHRERNPYFPKIARYSALPTLQTMNATTMAPR